ncbi:MAG: YggS family pyridoxal phosphate-dependent enzyme [Anaerolineales bacterium]
MNSVAEPNLAGNLAAVRDRMAAAAARAGRSKDEVELVAVTKGHPAETVRQAHRLGLSRFGENRVGEGLAKMQQLSDLPQLHWDMIGHVQSRKAGDVAPTFDRVHSVDRLKIARYLSRHAADRPALLPILLECNVSGEGSKYGFDISQPDREEKVLPVVQQIVDLPNLRVVGLMTMAPWTEDEDVVRGVFGGLRQFRDRLRRAFPAGDWNELSMGMTDDFALAIEEGATIVRIGRALFGPRDG